MNTVPETFVDGVGEISLKHGMVRIELVSLSGPEPRATQRLIVSVQAFSQMLLAQNGMREQLEKAGVLRPAQPPPEPDQPTERGVVPAVRRLARGGAPPAPRRASPPAGSRRNRSGRGHFSTRSRVRSAALTEFRLRLNDG